jgi:hypothetical protein
MQLAKMSQPHIAVVQQSFDECFKHYITVTPLLELGKMMSCYQTDLEGDTGSLILLSEQCVVRARTEKQWGQFRHFLRLKANWQKKAGQTEEARKSEEQRGESYLNDAEDCTSRVTPSYSAAARNVAKAITAYKELSPKHPRIAQLHRCTCSWLSIKTRVNLKDRRSVTRSIRALIGERLQTKLQAFPFLKRCNDYLASRHR